MNSPLASRALHFSLVASFFALLLASAAAAGPRPNILWITSEDHGPHMGCYGDTFADRKSVV